MSFVNTLSRACSNVRQMVWFNPERGRMYSVAVLICLAAVIACQFLLLGVYRHGKLQYGWDFGCFWEASRLALAGPAASPYNLALLGPAEATILPPGTYLPFLYPPPFLLLCLPLGLLPFLWSLALFLGVTGAAFAAAIYRATSSRWMVFAALGMPAVLGSLDAGQNSMMTAAIIGGGLALMDRRPRLAGLILGLMVIKPQLALAVPFALAFSQRWTVLLFAAVSALAMLVLSTLVLGVGVWPAFLASSKIARFMLEYPPALAHWKFQSAFGWVRELGASVPLAYAVQIFIFAGGLGLLWRARMRGVSAGVERALIVLVCLFATPYLVDYDLVLMAFPLAWLLAEWTRTEFPPWGKLMLLIAYVLPIAPIMKHNIANLWLGGTLVFFAYVIWTEQRPVPVMRQGVA